MYIRCNNFEISLILPKTWIRRTMKYHSSSKYIIFRDYCIEYTSPEYFCAVSAECILMLVLVRAKNIYKLKNVKFKKFVFFLDMVRLGTP